MFKLHIELIRCASLLDSENINRSNSWQTAFCFK